MVSFVSYIILAVFFVNVNSQCPAGQVETGPCIISCTDPTATCIGADCCAPPPTTTTSTTTTTTTTTTPTTTIKPTTTTLAPCADASTNCPTWKINGFCTSTFYTPAEKLQYCPLSCNLCSGTTVCVDSSASCPTWVNNNFCTSTFYTTTQKCQYCARSCNACGQC